MTGQEIRPGYKQTEVGVIPKDWEVRELREIGVADWGNTAVTKREYRDYGFQAFSASGPDGFVSWYEHDKPGVVISAIGAQCGKTWLAKGCWTPIKNTIWFRSDEAKASVDYLFRVTGDPNFWPKSGQAQPFVAVNSVRKALVALPPTVEEQRAIAAALADADALIAALESMIAKKRDLKQAAMQHLLTGKTRLSGFSGEWEPRSLGSISAFITKGATPTTYGFGWQSHGVLFLRSECVSDRGLELSQSMFISEEAHKVLKRGEVCSGDLLITITGNVGRVVQLANDFGVANINQHIARIRITSDHANAEYVYHQLSHPKYLKYFNSIVTGQAYPQISLKQVREAIVFFPTVNEQIAIAEVLSDMDADLAALEAQAAKARAVKQGMMQELLTGRVRLV